MKSKFEFELFNSWSSDCFPYAMFEQFVHLTFQAAEEINLRCWTLGLRLETIRPRALFHLFVENFEQWEEEAEVFQNEILESVLFAGHLGFFHWLHFRRACLVQETIKFKLKIYWFRRAKILFTDYHPNTKLYLFEIWLTRYFLK